MKNVLERGKKWRFFSFFLSFSIFLSLWQLNQLSSSPCKYRLLSDDIKVILLYHKSKRNHFSSFFRGFTPSSQEIQLRWKAREKTEFKSRKKISIGRNFADPLKQENKIWTRDRFDKGEETFTHLLETHFFFEVHRAFCLTCQRTRWTRWPDWANFRPMGRLLTTYWQFYWNYRGSPHLWPIVKVMH
jgi:hypothetical protein